MTLNLTKSALRIEARRIREMLGTEARAEASRKITDRLLAMKTMDQARRIAVYVSFEHEVCTHDLIAGLLGREKTVVLPRVAWRRESSVLDWHIVHEFPGGLIASRFGILEPPPAMERIDPAEIDLFIVPGLLFDLHGQRLGFGMGHYDRTFATAPQARRIAICYEAQLVAKLPTEPHDVPMHAILTERDLRRFTGFPA